jgi:hypothetical protein
MQLAHYLGLLHRAESALAAAFREVARAHGDEPDIEVQCLRQARLADERERKLEPIVQRYGEDADDEPERLHQDLFGGARSGKLALLRDLHDLYLMATECDVVWKLVGQAAQALRDGELNELVEQGKPEVSAALKWLNTRMKAAAPPGARRGLTCHPGSGRRCFRAEQHL